MHHKNCPCACTLSIILPQLRAKFNSFCTIGLFDHSKCGFLWENLGKYVPFVANLYTFGQNSIFAEVVAVVTKEKNLPNLGRFCVKTLFYKVCKAVFDVAKVEHDKFANVLFQNCGVLVETENFEQAYQKALGNGFANQRVAYLVGVGTNGIGKVLVDFFRNEFYQVVDKCFVVACVALADDDKFVRILGEVVGNVACKFRWIVVGKIQFGLDCQTEVFHKWIDNSKVQCFLVGKVTVDVTKGNFRIVGNVADGCVGVAVEFELLDGCCKNTIFDVFFEILHSFLLELPIL